MTRPTASLALVLCILACSCKASPIFRTDSSTDLVAVQGTGTELAVSQTTDLALPSTKEIDTLTEDETSVRVKRQGGCGCCCCRPCCCCCKPCCCCCRCCCCRCCCCRPCCCCCRCCRCCCCRPCCCGCGCCGCGGGRKRRALQNLRVALLNKKEMESKVLPIVLPAVDEETEDTKAEIKEEITNTPSTEDKPAHNSEIRHQFDY